MRISAALVRPLLLSVTVSALFFSACGLGQSQTNVLTYHNDNLRTGLNPNEKVLTTSNVNENRFGMLYALPVDGAVYGQPLYVTGVTIPNKGVHNVVFVVTENNSVYAFDATSSSSTPLWHVNLGPAVPASDTSSGSILPVIGITATPVIHLTSAGKGYIYVISKSKESDGHGGSIYVQRLHALNIVNGGEPIEGPKVIQATVAGVGDGNDGHGHVPFNPLIQIARPGLLYYSNGNTNMIVISWASHGDNGPYHGWVMAYDASSLRQLAVFNDTPNASTAVAGQYPLAAGGIWQGGAAPASDGTSIYLATGNGTFDPSTHAYGDCVLKLSSSLAVQDYFAPSDQSTLDLNDADLGSGGVMLLPNDPTYNPTASLLVQAGKDGTLHVCNTKSLGHFNSSDHIWGEFPDAMEGIFGNPAYFRGSIFYGPLNQGLSTFKISHGSWVGNGVLTMSSNNFGFPGPTPSVSSNGNANGIVWAVDSQAYDGSGNEGPAQLWAYDATNVSKTLYSSASTNGRDRMGMAVKFVTPLIDGGRVYVGTQSEVDVFGLGAFTPTPMIDSPSGSYSGTIMVSVPEADSAAKVYYTLDGSIPTASSTPYSGPISITGDATLSVKAFSSDAAPSGVATANYMISPTVGTGTGLAGKYYANMNLNGSPAVDRVDPTANFNWNAASPVTGIPADGWSASWTGQIEALGSTTYTFYAQSHDGVKLFVNGNLIINNWTDHGEILDTSATVQMVAGQKYTITVQHYQDQGESLLQLYWSSPGLPMEIVPKSQLYP
jgi:hypothetical protein